VLWVDYTAFSPTLGSISLIGSQTGLFLAIWVCVGSFVTMLYWSDEGEADPKIYGLWVILLGASLAEVLLQPGLNLVASGLILAVVIGAITGRLDSCRVGQRVLLQISLTQLVLLAGLLIGNEDHMEDAALILSGLAWLAMTPWQGSTRFISPRMLPFYFGVGCPLGLSFLSKLIFSGDTFIYRYQALLWLLFVAMIGFTVLLTFLGPKLAIRIADVFEKTQPRYRRSHFGLGWWDGWLLDGAIIRGTTTTFLIFGELVRLLQCGSVMVYLFLALLGGGLIYSELFLGP
jgi:hypothetical protein